MAAVLPIVVAQPSVAAARVVQSRTGSKTTLPSTIDPMVVQSITITSGAWTVIGKAYVVDITTGESDFFRCELYNAANGKHLDVAAAWVSSSYPASMITNIAKLKVATGTSATIQQRCWHDHFDIAGGYVDPGATLLGTKAASATQNRAYRSTSSVKVASISGVTVGSLGIAAGTWVYGFKATAVDVGTNAEKVACTVPGGSTVRQSVGTRTTWPSVATLAAFGAVSTPTATTITVSCATGDNGGQMYLDPGVVLWARQVSSAVIGGSCVYVSSSVPQGAVADMRDFQCSIGFGSGASQVGGVGITSGAWVVLGAEQADGNDRLSTYIRCKAVDAGNNKVVDPHADVRTVSGLTDPTFETTTTYVGKLKTSIDTVVEFRCGQVGSGVYTGTSSAGGYVAFKA